MDSYVHPMAWIWGYAPSKDDDNAPPIKGFDGNPTGTSFVSYPETPVDRDTYLAAIAESYRLNPEPVARGTDTPKVFSERFFSDCNWTAKGCQCTRCQAKRAPVRLAVHNITPLRQQFKSGTEIRKARHAPKQRR